MPVHTMMAYGWGRLMYTSTYPQPLHYMGVCGWLHNQATLPQGKKPRHHRWCEHFMQTWC